MNGGIQTLKRWDQACWQGAAEMHPESEAQKSLREEGRSGRELRCITLSRRGR